MSRQNRQKKRRMERQKQREMTTNKPSLEGLEPLVFTLDARPVFSGKERDKEEDEWKERRQKRA